MSEELTRLHGELVVAVAGLLARVHQLYGKSADLNQPVQEISRLLAEVTTEVHAANKTHNPIAEPNLNHNPFKGTSKETKGPEEEPEPEESEYAKHQTEHHKNKSVQHKRKS